MSKISAGIIYMGAIGVAIISPLIFISSVILNEFIVHHYPEDERYDAVGQVCTSYHIFADFFVEDIY